MKKAAALLVMAVSLAFSAPVAMGMDRTVNPMTTPNVTTNTATPNATTPNAMTPNSAMTPTPVTPNSTTTNTDGWFDSNRDRNNTVRPYNNEIERYGHYNSTGNLDTTHTGIRGTTGYRAYAATTNTNMNWSWLGLLGLIGLAGLFGRGRDKGEA